jgi:hypothetical protein
MGLGLDAIAEVVVGEDAAFRQDRFDRRDRAADPDHCDHQHRDHFRQARVFVVDAGRERGLLLLLFILPQKPLTRSAGQS